MLGYFLPNLCISFKYIQLIVTQSSQNVTTVDEDEKDAREPLFISI